MLEQYETEEKNRLYEKEFLKIFNSASIPLTGKAQSRRKGICATTVARPTTFTAVYPL